MIRSKLQRKEKTRSGIQRALARDFPAHRRFVRRHVCQACAGSDRIECAHLRLETGGGMSVKPHDAWTLSLCAGCHSEQHWVGEVAFWAARAKDPWKLCLAFAQASPIEEVRDYARGVMVPLIERHAEYDARIAALAMQEAA